MLEKFGYTKETVKRYDMTMGDLILLISRKLFEAGKSDIEIRLLNTFPVNWISFPACLI